MEYIQLPKWLTDNIWGWWIIFVLGMPIIWLSVVGLATIFMLKLYLDEILPVLFGKRDL